VRNPLRPSAGYQSPRLLSCLVSLAPLSHCLLLPRLRYCLLVSFTSPLKLLPCPVPSGIRFSPFSVFFPRPYLFIFSPEEVHFFYLPPPRTDEWSSSPFLSSTPHFFLTVSALRPPRRSRPWMLRTAVRECADADAEIRLRVPLLLSIEATAHLLILNPRPLPRRISPCLPTRFLSFLTFRTKAIRQLRGLFSSCQTLLPAVQSLYLPSGEPLGLSNAPGGPWHFAPDSRSPGELLPCPRSDDAPFPASSSHTLFLSLWLAIVSPSKKKSGLLLTPYRGLRLRLR